MKAKIIFYSQENLTPKDKTSFKEELSGRNTSSSGGRYKYKIKGLVDKVKTFRPCRSVIIVQNVDYEKIIKLMDEHKVIHQSYIIDIPSSKFKK